MKRLIPIISYIILVCNFLSAQTDGISYQAVIIDPNGRILVETSKAGDDMVIADLEGSLLAPSVGQAFLKARRPDLYGPLTEKTGREEDTRSLKFKE